MLFPCEQLANKIIPAIRAEIAIKLSTSYGMKQIEISQILGVTQGAVSHYLSSFRGKERDIITTNHEINKEIDDIAFSLLNDDFNENIFCTICQKIRKLSSPNL